MVHLIDTLHLDQPNAIAAGLIPAADGSLLMVDCGPDTVFDHLVEGIRALGFDPAKVQHLVLTHIHFDHAGGAWRWADQFGTKVYVHPNGALHLIQPERLVSSAAKIYGPRMGVLWGEIRPIGEANVVEVDEGDRIKAPGVELETIFTPGHAQHHNAYWMASERTIFGGDVTGVTISDGPAIPPCPPPDVHLESWRESLHKIRRYSPEAFFLPHFGWIKDPEKKLLELETNLLEWADWMKKQLKNNVPEKELTERFRQMSDSALIEAGTTKETRLAYEHANPSGMSAGGLARYWKKYHPEELR